MVTPVYLDPDRVLIDVAARSKKHALEIVSELIASALDTTSGTKVLNIMFRREKLGSTYLGHGVSLPHARLAGISEPVGAFIRLAEPIDFDADDGAPVSLIYGLLLPDIPERNYAAELAMISDLLLDDSLRLQLDVATIPVQVYRLLSSYQPPATGLEASG